MIFSTWDFFTHNKEAQKIISLLNIITGQSVVEIGAGKGLMSFAVAKTVDDSGFVFSTEHDAEKLNKLNTKAVKLGLKNLHTAKAGEDSPNLPDKMFDAIFMCKVYHHFTQSAKQNAAFYSHLKPGGQLAIIDFEPRWYLKMSTPKGIPASYGGHGVYKNVVIDEVQQAGFKLKQMVDDFGGGMYCAIFEKV
ncbi:MAG: methyltransferase [Candidatus Doudnabacteria bacterium]|nr:methyltransferase [Candidatus Doudnabacteria bacterium]